MGWNNDLFNYLDLCVLMIVLVMFFGVLVYFNGFIEYDVWFWVCECKFVV